MAQKGATNYCILTLVERTKAFCGLTLCLTTCRTTRGPAAKTRGCFFMTGRRTRKSGFGGNRDKQGG